MTDFRDIQQYEYDDEAKAKRIIGSANYVLFDANDSAPIYIGLNNNADATTAQLDWIIYKLVYSGANVTSIRRKIGSWDNRATYF